MEAIRVLHVSPNMFGEWGHNGATERIWQELAKDCEEYHLLGRSPDNAFHSYSKGKIHIHTVPGLGKRNISFAFTGCFVGTYAKKHNINVIICQCPILGGIWAVRFGRSHHIPVIVELHDYLYFRMLRGSRLRDRLGSMLIRYSLERASIVRALNEDMKRQLIALGIRNKEIRVVYNRVDFSLYNRPKTNFLLHDPIKLISVGTFTKRKGYELIFRAIEAIADDPKNFNIILIGGGELRPRYEELSKETGIPCEIHDRIPQQQIVEIMSDCDIYIQSSYSEGVPRAIIEAMAMRMPIITTDVGFTSGAILDGKSGLLIPAGDIESMGRAIKKMIESEALRKSLASRAYEDAREHFEWNQCFDRYRDLIQDAMIIGKQ